MITVISTINNPNYFPKDSASALYPGLEADGLEAPPCDTSYDATTCLLSPLHQMCALLNHCASQEWLGAYQREEPQPIASCWTLTKLLESVVGFKHSVQSSQLAFAFTALVRDNHRIPSFLHHWCTLKMSVLWQDILPWQMSTNYHTQYLLPHDTEKQIGDVASRLQPTPEVRKCRCWLAKMHFRNSQFAPSPPKSTKIRSHARERYRVASALCSLRSHKNRDL